MHAYIYARRRRNLAILRKITINFFGFSNASFIFLTFSHLWDFTFSYLLYSTFSHLLYFTYSHLLYFTFSHLLYSTFSHLLYFTFSHLLDFELLYSSFFPSEFPSQITFYFLRIKDFLLFFFIVVNVFPSPLKIKSCPFKPKRSILKWATYYREHVKMKLAFLADV